MCGRLAAYCHTSVTSWSWWLHKSRMSVPSGSAGGLQPVLEHLGLHQAADVLTEWLDRAAAQELSYADFLQGLLEEESTARANAATQKRLRQAPSCRHQRPDANQRGERQHPQRQPRTYPQARDRRPSGEMTPCSRSACTSLLTGILRLREWS